MSQPNGVTEVSGQLKKSGQVTLDANGNGVLIFDPDNAWQRWETSSVVVSTNQPASATVIPVATLALNSITLATMSGGNQRGATWSGNQDVFSGTMHVGPCDFMSVMFSPPPGQAGSALAGVVCTAVVTGTKYTRRA
jgi:hypothetical protein